MLLSSKQAERVFEVGWLQIEKRSVWFGQYGLFIIWLDYETPWVQDNSEELEKQLVSICQREDGLGSCDIYISQKMGDNLWSPGMNLGSNINSKNWESQPSVSPDGKTLYFVRGVKSTSKNINILKIKYF